MRTYDDVDDAEDCEAVVVVGGCNVEAGCPSSAVVTAGVVAPFSFRGLEIEIA